MGSTSPAYMEQALAEQFEEISTASYQYRSEIFDEVVTSSPVRTTWWSTREILKRVTSASGAEKTLFPGVHPR